MKSITKYIGIVLIFIVTTSFIDDIAWKLEKSKDGIQVYSYIADGDEIKQLKSHTRIKTSLSSLISVLADVESYKNWIYKCVVSKKIKAISYNKMVYYTESDAPFPILNRELYSLNTFYQDKKTNIIYSISKPLPNNNTIPVPKGLIRVTNFYGMWKFTPLSNGEVSIDYFLKIDPAGKLPAWLVNMTLEIGPYQSLVNFKKEVLLPKHQKAKYDFINE